MDLKFNDDIMRKASRLEEESLGCLVERDGYIAIAAQVKLSLIFCRWGEINFDFLPPRWNYFWWGEIEPNPALSSTTSLSSTASSWSSSWPDYKVFLFRAQFRSTMRSYRRSSEQLLKLLLISFQTTKSNLTISTNKNDFSGGRGVCGSYKTIVIMQDKKV